MDKCIFPIDMRQIEISTHADILVIFAQYFEYRIVKFIGCCDGRIWWSLEGGNGLDPGMFTFAQMTSGIDDEVQQYFGVALARDCDRTSDDELFQLLLYKKVYDSVIPEMPERIMKHGILLEFFQGPHLPAPFEGSDVLFFAEHIVQHSSLLPEILRARSG